MPKNVMKLVKPSPHRARNDFDMSHRHVLSANFGELLPVTTVETVPGDHITMHASNLLRAIPMVTSPFLRAKQHIDVWFVPYTDLWHNFNQFMTQKTEPVSSALQGSSYLPWANLYNLQSVGIDATLTDVVGRAQNLGASRLLNYLGYGYQTIGTGASTSASVNLFRLAAYNYIWYNEYRQQYYDSGYRLLPSNTNIASLFNFDNLRCDSLANAEVSSTLYAAMCQMRYRCWKKDLFTGLMPSTQFGAVSTVSSSLGTNSELFRLAAINPNSGNLELSGSDPNYVGVGGSSRDFIMTNQSGVGISPSVDILSLRRSEAVQIWRENALRAGDPYAVALWQEMSLRNAQAMGMFINIFNPQKLVLGTLAWAVGDLYVQPILEALPRFCWEEPRKACEIVNSELKREISSYAGIAAALNLLKERNEL